MGSKTHRRLHNGHDAHPSLQTRVVGGLSVPKNAWHYPGNDADMLPYNRIREVIELDVRYENQLGTAGHDEEMAVHSSQKPMSVKNTLT